jgi:tRNA1(Val) A37 N6-methylase TrmN6
MLIYQPKNGYCYNSDSIILFYFFNKILKITNKQTKQKQQNKTFLDVGSGSGLLGLLICAKYKKFNYESSICELQDNFAFLSKKNYEINNFKTTLYKGNFTNINPKHKFDYIISNPPFYDANTKQCLNINKKIARYDDNLSLISFLQTSKKLLKKEAMLFFCYRVNALENIKKQIIKNGLKMIYIQWVYKNKKEDPKLVLICVTKQNKTKNSIIKPKVFKNIYSHKQNRLSKKMNYIYKNINTHSIKVDYD